MSPDGSPDQNIFDIRQGVSVIVACKSASSGPKSGNGTLATVQHGDIWGSRDCKYKALAESVLAASVGKPLTLKEPYFAFDESDKQARGSERWMSAIDLRSLLPVSLTGVQTSRDDLALACSRGELREKITAFLAQDYKENSDRFGIKNTSFWNMDDAKNILRSEDQSNGALNYLYRPFDIRVVQYSDAVVHRRKASAMQNFINGLNIGLLLGRQGQVVGSGTWNLIFVQSEISDLNVFYRGGGLSLPLYLRRTEQLGVSSALNLEPKLYATICAAAGIDPADQAGPDDDFRASTGEARPSEVKVFDYIYGVLHAPNYRETFAEFLKIDFPRVPHPPSPAAFTHVSAKGEQLRRLHLMEPAAIGDTPYPYHGEGDDVVASGYPKLEGGKVHINKNQYFDAVPPIAWTFHIGGYHPAQKWLKDRRGRALSWDDIGHYQKIVKILTETDRIMREIDLPLATE